MFVETGATGFTRIVTDTDRHAEVRKIGGPPRGDTDATMDDLLLTWEHRQITFCAVRTKISDYTLDDDGHVVETIRPLLVDFQNLGGGGRHQVDRTEYAPYTFSSSAEHAEATTLAVEGFIAWYCARRRYLPASVDVLTYDLMPHPDRLLGELHTARIRTVAVPTPED